MKILLLLFGLICAIFFLGILLIFSFINKIRNLLKGNNNTQKDKNTQKQHRTTRYSTGETIIDARNREQTERKIFAKDEGEYIDYEEKK